MINKYKKIIRTCEKNDIYHYDGNLYKERFFLLLENNEDKKIFKDALDKFHIYFAKEYQDKINVFIKIDDKFVIVEYKKIETANEEQNKQITEMIEFIKYGERKVYYVSYLDGILFNKIFSSKPTRKLYKFKNDIISYLKLNPYNSFVNESEFNNLLDNICK